MSAGLSDAQKAEAECKANCAGLIEEKKEELATLTATVEAKLTQQGDLAIEVESLKNDVAEMKRTLTADQELAAKLAESCSSQSSQWEELQKSRAQELLPIHDTIKLLNDDDALELFKAILPSPPPVQIRSRTVVLPSQALEDIRRLSSALHDVASNLKLIDLALREKSVDFSKIISMIDEMVTSLHAKHGDDGSKKAYEKVPAKTIAGHKGDTQEFQDKLSSTDAWIKVVQLVSLLPVLPKPLRSDRSSTRSSSHSQRKKPRPSCSSSPSTD